MRLPRGLAVSPVLVVRVLVLWLMVLSSAGRALLAAVVRGAAVVRRGPVVGRGPVVRRAVVCPGGLWLARALVLIEVARIAGAGPGVSEDKKAEPVQADFRHPARQADHEKGHEGGSQLAHGRELAALLLG